MDLYSSDISERERAASRYRVFSESLTETPLHWSTLLDGRKLNDGLVWPKFMQRLVDPETWPEHAFGTANAACLVVWHRPGKVKRMDHRAGDYIGPHTPILGGIGHAHNELWHKLHPNRSWFNLHKFLPQALAKSLVNPWSQVMLVCLNPIPGETGSVDEHANDQAVSPGGRLDSIVDVCRPLVVLACGKPVCKSIRQWSNPMGIQVIRASHPLMWNGFGGVYDGPKVVEELQTKLNISTQCRC